MYKTVINPADLPVIPEGATIYLDVETTNHTGRGRPKDSMVWMGDKIVGAAVTFDACPDCWYIPVRHTEGPNIPIENFQRWLKDAVTKAGKWINHNIKFDMHFARVDGAEFGCQVVDTMVQARIIHNNLPSYGLKELCVQYLGVENWKDPIKDFLTAYKTKNWGDVPVSLMAIYACQDVDNNRKLYHKFNELLPEDCQAVWSMEQLLTPVLYDLEVQGFVVDPEELQREYDMSLETQYQLQSKLEGLIGHEINVNSNKQLTQLFLEQLKLPVVARTDKGNPSFGAEAMGLYQSLPEVLSNPRIRDTLQQMGKLVTERHFCSLFLKSYLELHANGIIHPTYLQCKKTGRMGCKQPNSQQLNTRAKKLVKCLPGHNIWSWDASQIEYRLIVHYTQNAKAIKAYNENTATDYHSWVAELARIERLPAKTLNFLMAYGGGEKKAMEFLSKTDVVIDEVNTEVQRLIEQGAEVEENRSGLFQQIFTAKAKGIYNQYHAAQPELKQTLYKASRVVEQRGYVRTISGRRNYIPTGLSYKGLNGVIQGSAADIFKNRLIVYSPRYNKTVRGWGIKPFAVIHDDVTSQVPIDINEETYVSYTKAIFENSPYSLDVPLIVKFEKSTHSWGA